MPSDDDNIRFIQLTFGPYTAAVVCTGPAGCGGIVLQSTVEQHEAFHRRVFPSTDDLLQAPLTPEQLKELGDMGPATDEPGVPADQGSKGETK